MIIEKKCNIKLLPFLDNADLRSALKRNGRRSLSKAFFYKHETTYRGLKFCKIEKFKTKLLFENFNQNMNPIY
jgi:hypothetical protein